MKNFLKKHSSVILVLLFLFLTFLMTYPAGYLSIDEHDYVENSKLIFTGGLQQPCDPDKISQIDIGPYCIYKYNIGASILMLPMNFWGEYTVYLLAFSAFLISVVIVYQILRKLGINKNLFILYALFPAFLFYGRTAYSEVYSMLLGVLFLFFYMKGKRRFNIWSGASIGMSMLVRPTNLFWFAIFLLTDLIMKGVFKKGRLGELINLVLEMLIGFLPFLTFFLLFNNYLYLSPFNSGYTFSGDFNNFDLTLLPGNLLRYLVLLNIFYPGMLFLSLKSKLPYKWPIVLSFLGLLLFYSATLNNNFKSDINLIIGIRFLIPALPFIMLLYIDVLKDYLKGRTYYFVFGFLIVLITLMQFLHFRYLNETVPFWMENHQNGLINNEISWW